MAKSSVLRARGRKPNAGKSVVRLAVVSAPVRLKADTKRSDKPEDLRKLGTRVGNVSALLRAAAVTLRGDEEGLLVPARKSASALVDMAKATLKEMVSSAVNLN